MTDPTIAPVAAPAAVPWRAALLGVTFAGGLVATASGDDGVVLCPYRRCTGGWCPGCGATRAAHRLFTGDLAGAWSHHPWVVLAAAQLLGVVVAVLLGPRLGARRRAGARSWVMPALIANTVALLGIWAVRTSSGSIPTWW